MTTLPGTLPGLLDAERIRKDFPILDRIVHGDKPLVYLDNAATSQKPRRVLDALDDYYEKRNANVHRGIHVLAEEATALYEQARDKVAALIKAPSRDEVVFTKNSSEALNLVANVLGWAEEPYGIRRGDEIVITQMEHHSNIVPWQLTAQRSGARLKWLGLTDDGRLDLSNLDEMITERTKVVSVVHVSNILGTINPIDAIVRRAHAVGAMVVVDASQSAPHLPLDVAALGADFVAFTGHKMCGPTGIGVRPRPTRPCRTSSRPAPRRSPRRSGWARRWITSPRSAWRRSRRTNTPSPSTPSARCTPSRACGSSGRTTPSTARPRSRSRSATSTLTTWARSSTSSASRCAWATTAHAPCASATACRPPHGRRSTSTPPPGKSTPWSQG
jgi:hypothetical protein